VQRHRSLVAIGVLGAVLLLVVIGGVSLVLSDRDKPTPGLPAGRAMVSHEVDDGAVDLPSGAQAHDDPLAQIPKGATIDSSEKAAAHAVKLLGAENPQIRSVELITLEQALIDSQESSREEPDLAIAGWSRHELDALVWRVVLEADEVSAPVSCDPPEDSEPECLPPRTPVEMIFDPRDGGWIHATFGSSR
jgi:hypothetical protein